MFWVHMGNIGEVWMAYVSFPFSNDLSGKADCWFNFYLYGCFRHAVNLVLWVGKKIIGESPRYTVDNLSKLLWVEIIGRWKYPKIIVWYNMILYDYIITRATYSPYNG